MKNIDFEKIANLVEKTKMGDKSAFSDIYATYVQKIYFICLELLKSPQDAQDATQEIFLNAFQKINTLENPNAFEKWIFVSTTRKCADICKRKNPKLFSDFDDLQITKIAEDYDTSMSSIQEEELIEKETADNLNKIISSLPYKLRSAIVCYYYANMSISEIADAEGVSENLIKTRLFVARQKLKEKIESSNDEKLESGILLIPLALNECSENITVPKKIMSATSVGSIAGKTTFLGSTASKITVIAISIILVSSAIIGAFAINSKANKDMGIKIKIEDTTIDTIQDTTTTTIIACVELDNKWGAIDKDGDFVIESRFDKMGSFHEGLVEAEINEKWGFLDESGNFVIEPQFDDTGYFNDGLATVKISDKWGYIDKKGNFVIGPQFSYAGTFNEGLAYVELDNKIGYIDKEGNWAIKVNFDYAGEFNEGLAYVRVGEKFGFIDKKGDFAIEPKFDSAESFSEGLAAVRLEDKVGFIDKNGNYAIEPKFKTDLFYYPSHNTYKFNDGFATIVVNGKLALIDRDGNYVIDPQSGHIGEFSEGLIAVAGEKDGKISIGYMNESGNFVIDPQFDSAGEFHNGYAPVIIDDNVGFIDKTGKIIIEPQFYDVSDSTIAQYKYMD